MADLAPHVPGAGYTFFVPTDEAFDRVGLDSAEDGYLATGDGLSLLLNHFVARRLYARDLADGTTLDTLGNKTLRVSRKHGERLLQALLLPPVSRCSPALFLHIKPHYLCL